MAAESSRSSASADSYIGSLISLTSKSEIRYEGILYNINTEESSIGLSNVRSFGTEGRKKDGPQVPPSDKVYEYILFRGSDIKDLQVKSSPPVQATPPINSDPAIIQSHYPRPASTTASLPTAANGSLSDLSTHNPQLGHSASAFQGGLPLYQPGGNLGSWGPSPPTNANGSGLAMPMYWQGFYGPPNGLPHMHQQSLLRPPPGLSLPPSMPPPLQQYSGFNASLPTGAANLPEFPSPLVPTSGSSLNLAPTSLPPSTLPPNVPVVTLASETLLSSIPNRAPTSGIPTISLAANSPSLSFLTSSNPDVNVAATSNKSYPVTGSLMPYQSMSQPITTLAGAAGLIQVETHAPSISGQALAYQSMSQSVTTVVGTTSFTVEEPTPSLITPGQLLQTVSATVSSTPSHTAHKDVEVVQVSPTPATEPSVPTEAQPPILPLPSHSRSQKPNGTPFQTRNNYRGRGRSSRFSGSAARFTEEFDFMAMNEKFNKDEVWGHLGKSSKSHAKEKEEDGDGSEEDDYEDEDDAELPKFEAKPVYKKDDFFDSLSSNALDNASSNARIRFSEQMKIDTETFGDFSRYRGGRGGRGPRGGRSRGSYYGRGYGYIGRGRGGGVSYRP